MNNLMKIQIEILFCLIVEIKDMLEMFYPNIILESFGPGTRRSLVGPHDERIIFA